MVCKVGFTNCNVQIAPLLASMVVTYYIKLFRTVADRHNGILMSLLLLVAETIISYDTNLKVIKRKLGLSSYFQRRRRTVYNYKTELKRERP